MFFKLICRGYEPLSANSFSRCRPTMLSVKHGAVARSLRDFIMQKGARRRRRQGGYVGRGCLHKILKVFHGNVTFLCIFIRNRTKSKVEVYNPRFVTPVKMLRVREMFHTYGIQAVSVASATSR